MKGRGCSGLREGKGRLRLIGTHSASVLPAKEVLRAAGCYTCRSRTCSVTIGLLPLYCSFLWFSCDACLYSMDRAAELVWVCIYEHFCNFRYVVVPIAKFVRGNKRIIELQRMRK
jgi:hypothetical protein